MTDVEEHGETAVGWLLHTLEPEQERRFLAHMPGCDECREAVGEAAPVLEAFARAVPQHDPPPRLRERIRAAAAAEDHTGAHGTAVVVRAESSPAPVPPVSVSRGRGDRVDRVDDDGSVPEDKKVVALDRRARRRKWIVRGVAVAAIGAALAAVGGLTAANQTLRQDRDAAVASADEAERVVQMLDDAAAPGVRRATLTAADGEFAGLVADAGQGPQVLVSGLPGNTSDRTYVLWGLGGEKPVGLGTFDLPGSTSAVRSVRSSEQAAPFTGYAVSLEPGRTVPAAPTDIVAKGQVGR